MAKKKQKKKKYLFLYKVYFLSKKKIWASGLFDAQKQAKKLYKNSKVEYAQAFKIVLEEKNE